MESVLFGCHEICVLNEILALKYCNSVMSLLKKKNKQTTFTLLDSVRVVERVIFSENCHL